jgi:hypothetical protein
MVDCGTDTMTIGLALRRDYSSSVAQCLPTLGAQFVVGTIPRIATAHSPIIVWRFERNGRMGQSGDFQDTYSKYESAVCTSGVTA